MKNMVLKKREYKSYQNKIYKKYLIQEMRQLCQR
jgi:hypothetical protein